MVKNRDILNRYEIDRLELEKLIKQIHKLKISNNQLKFEFNIDCLYRIGICTNEKLVKLFFDNEIELTLMK